MKRKAKVRREMTGFIQYSRDPRDQAPVCRVLNLRASTTCTFPALHAMVTSAEEGAFLLLTGKLGLTGPMLLVQETPASASGLT